MFFESLDFAARVPLAGYMVTAAACRQPLPTQETYWVTETVLIAERPRTGGDGGYRLVRPDRVAPVLFRRFADLGEGGADGFVDFANEFGVLDQPGMAAERLDRWQDAARHLWLVLLLKDFAQAGDNAALGRYLRWGKSNGYQGVGWHVYLPRRWPKAEDPTRFAPPEPGARLRGGWRPMFWDVAGDGARHVVGPSDAADLREVTRQWVDSEIDQQVARASGLRFTRDEGTGRRALRVQVGDLRGLMWFQLARAIADNKDLRPCAACGVWFELLPKHRGRKEFCDLKCKLRDYRKRQRQAQELAANGSSPKEIAAAIETDLATVKRWVRKGR